ncbi:hypothetical protein GCM10009777_25320 [Microbacterium pumilum]|uniref:HNH nuclease domain-containing protein n=2 Tax=Microbacterium pumilum TaxID=344165 RepID=A0ABP5E3A1_9MICO
MDAADNDLTVSQWARIREAWGGCAYCGATDAALQRDCVLALSRGGRYTIENIVPACRSCNASKSNDEVTRWLRRKRLDERAFLLRHREVLALLMSEPSIMAAPVGAGDSPVMDGDRALTSAQVGAMPPS